MPSLTVMEQTSKDARSKLEDAARIAAGDFVAGRSEGTKALESAIEEAAAMRRDLEAEVGRIGRMIDRAKNLRDQIESDPNVGRVLELTPEENSAFAASA